MFGTLAFWNSTFLTCGRRIYTLVSHFNNRTTMEYLSHPLSVLTSGNLTSVHYCIMRSYLLLCSPGLNTAQYKLYPLDFWHHRAPRHSGKRARRYEQIYGYWDWYLQHRFHKFDAFNLKLPCFSSYLCLRRRQTSGPQSAWHEKDTELCHQEKQDGISPGTGPLGLDSWG